MNPRRTYLRMVALVQRHVANPIARRMSQQVVIETVGRVSGLPRQTPVGGRLEGRTLWVVSEFGRQSNYVRNLEAQPRVRVRLWDTWYAATATPVDDDDVAARLRQLPRVNSALVRAIGRGQLTIRFDLDEVPAKR